MGPISPQTAQSHRLHDGEQVLYAVVELANQQPLPVFEAFAFPDINQGSEHVVAPLVSHWFEPNLDRNLASIPMQSYEIAAHSNRSVTRAFCKSPTHVRMRNTQTLGNQHFDRLAEQFVVIIAEQLLHILVHENDVCPGIDNE